MSNNIPPNLEILKMARDIVHDEYVDTKAQLHNKWLVDADLLWRTTRTRLAYPTFPPFPTEDVVVARAKVLLEFLSKKDETPIEPLAVEQVPEPVVEVIPVQEEPVQEPVQEEQKEEEQESTDSNTQPLESKPDTNYTNVNKELSGADLLEAIEKSTTDYTNTLVSRRNDAETTMSSRMLPSLLKRIDEMKKNWA